MAACDRASVHWGEVAITEIVTSRAAPTVSVAQFNQNEEATSGADWMWWWVDATASYGTLVQAKRVTVNRDAWRFGFDYTSRNGRSQRSTLTSAARKLGVAPVYAIYLGTPEYRRWEPCPEDHQGRRCLPCKKRSVSVMPAIVADDKVRDSVSTYKRSVALEELWLPDPPRKWPVGATLRATLSPELFTFLTTPQTGACAVAKKMIDRVLEVRLTEQFGAVSALTPRDSVSSDGEHDRLGSIFTQLPDDVGHWTLPYFEQVLSPLHHAPPPYVLKLESSGSLDIGDLPSAARGSVAGVVVVRLPQSG